MTVKSVNHRFLDLQLRMPPSLGAARVAAASAGAAARGARPGRGQRHRCSSAASPALEVELNEAFLDALTAALERARERGLHRRRDDAGRPAALPAGAGDPREAARTPDGGRRAARRRASRRPSPRRSTSSTRCASREGGYLRADLDARRAAARRARSSASRAAAEQGIDGAAARGSQERVRELRADALADEALVAQEIAKFVGRSDITEEVVRFRGHLEHWQALSDSPEPCGRKLDFLLQEMNREVNTIGSKAEGPAVSELIVTLKAELEKMREQVQNVE